MYYKAVIEESIVDVYDVLNCVKYNSKSKMVLRCNLNDDPGGVIQRNGTKIYQVNGWTSLNGDYETIDLVEFDDEDTYKALLNALDVNDTVEDTNDEEEEEIDNSDLDYVIEAKLKVMSAACESAIISGFDITLSDGESHHFSLELTDQIMISALALKAAQGEDNLPWHADNEPCQFWSATDILAINNAMESLITYHQTYFNSLKMYILSLDNVKDVDAIIYGVEIPEDYQSDVYKAMIANVES